MDVTMRTCCIKVCPQKAMNWMANVSGAKKKKQQLHFFAYQAQIIVQFTKYVYSDRCTWYMSGPLICPHEMKLKKRNIKQCFFARRKLFVF